jgi:hypothetical protein
MKVMKKRPRRVVTPARTATMRKKRRAVIREGQEAREQRHHGRSQRTPKRPRQVLQHAVPVVDVEAKHQVFP